MTQKTRPSRTIVTFTTRERQDVRGLIPSSNGNRLKELWKIDQEGPPVEQAKKRLLETPDKPLALDPKPEPDQAVTA